MAELLYVREERSSGGLGAALVPVLARAQKPGEAREGAKARTLESQRGAQRTRDGAGYVPVPSSRSSASENSSAALEGCKGLRERHRMGHSFFLLRLDASSEQASIALVVEAPYSAAASVAVASDGSGWREADFGAELRTRTQDSSGEGGDEMGDIADEDNLPLVSWSSEEGQTKRAKGEEVMMDAGKRAPLCTRSTLSIGVLVADDALHGELRAAAEERPCGACHVTPSSSESAEVQGDVPLAALGGRASDDDVASFV